MSPRFARIAALTIGGGVALSATAGISTANAADSGASAPQAGVIGESRVWTALDDYTRAEFAAAKARTAAATQPQYPTAETPSGQVVPLKKYEVGHLFGIADSVHTGGVHSGVDMSAPQGTPIYAVEGGKVIAAEWQGAAGKAVTIKTTDGVSVLYGHMNSMAVDKGDKVKTGDMIGRVGSTGNSTGPHLHVGVFKANGKLQDPLVWMDLSAKQLGKLSQ